MYTVVVKRKKDGHIITLSFLIVMSILFILMGLNTKNPDYWYYEQLFYRAQNGISIYSVETGFWLLVNVASKIGMNYSQFLIVYTAIGLILIGNSLILYTRKPILSIVCYFCYPFFLDLVQIRHFMAMAIFVFASRYLLHYNRANLIKYCLLIFLAATQHIIALAFLFFLIAYLMDCKKILCVSLLVVILTFVGLRPIYSSAFIQNILALRNREYSAGVSFGQSIMYPLFYVILVTCCYILFNVNNKKSDPKVNRVSNAMIKVCISSIVFIPFILIDYQYTRLFRGCILIIYMYISDQICLLKKTNRLIVTIILLLVVLSVNIKLFGPGSGYYDPVTKSIFFDNMLFKTFQFYFS